MRGDEVGGKFCRGSERELEKGGRAAGTYTAASASSVYTRKHGNYAVNSFLRVLSIFSPPTEITVFFYAVLTAPPTDATCAWFSQGRRDGRMHVEKKTGFFFFFCLVVEACMQGLGMGRLT